MRRFLFALVLLASAGLLAPVALATPSQVETKTPEGKTGIEWAVTPGNAIVFLDGKKIGSASDLAGKVTKAQPGKHTIKLTKGGDEQEMDVKVTKGQVVRVEFSFSE